MITYKYLLDTLLELTQRELEQNVTVYIAGMDEFLPVSVMRISGEDGQFCPAVGVLDDGHHFLEINV